MLKAAFGIDSPVGLGPLELNSVCKELFTAESTVTLELFLELMPVIIPKVHELAPKPRRDHGRDATTARRVVPTVAWWKHKVTPSGSS